MGIFLIIKAELVPPKPNELLKKALMDFCCVLLIIFSLALSSSGVSKLMLGAIKSCCIISMLYMSSLAPAIQHSCPVIDLVELTGVLLPNTS